MLEQEVGGAHGSRTRHSKREQCAPQDSRWSAATAYSIAHQAPKLPAGTLATQSAVLISTGRLVPPQSVRAEALRGHVSHQL
jgi:hypothetical protein